MIPLFAIRLIAGASLLAALTAGGYAVYNKVYQAGYTAAEQKYTLILNEQKALIDTKIKSIETLATTLVDEGRASDAKLNSDVSGILSKVRGKTLTIIKDGGCTPSQTFSDTFTSVNKRVNQSMQDKKP